MSDDKSTPPKQRQLQQRQFPLKNLFIATAMISIGVAGMCSVVDANWSIEKTHAFGIGIWYGSATIIVYGLMIAIGAGRKSMLISVLILGPILGAVALWATHFWLAR